MVEQVNNNQCVSGVTCFSLVSEPLGAFDSALQVMELLSTCGVGLGEVICDYARQTHDQMCDLLSASENLLRGEIDEETVTHLNAAYAVLGSAATVLEMTPAAMLRNHTEVVGAGSKISREEIVRITRAFKQAPEVMALTHSEDACQAVVMQALTEKNALAKLPPLAAMQVVNTQIHHSA
jgi:hypothetical protein